ncbi:MAG: hypothetical protein HYT42_02210 [Candidatus Sungbacteria bacterium]|nr:hypothetical protein [Candidatus Sungbacteria bacterium]
MLAIVLIIGAWNLRRFSTSSASRRVRALASLLNIKEFRQRRLKIREEATAKKLLSRAIGENVWLPSASLYLIAKRVGGREERALEILGRIVARSKELGFGRIPPDLVESVLS